MAVERTLFFVKPDGMARELIGECIFRLERKGLRFIATKLMRLTLKQAMKHYSEHKGKPFFDGLVTHVTSGPIMAFVIEGDNAVSAVRALLGSAHDPPTGTIRGDFAQSVALNVAHASDSPQAAAREIPLFFNKAEFIDWERASGPSIHE
jgi:nucleoside-diphosphate kinase